MASGVEPSPCTSILPLPQGRGLTMSSISCGNPTLQCGEEASLRPRSGALTTVGLEKTNHLCYHRCMLDIKHTINRVYQTAYHLVWCPVYRRDILYGEVKTTLEALFAEICRIQVGLRYASTGSCQKVIICL